ncbi:hypothetical protein SAMN05421663_10870 [Terribacillus halophilus]|uniref:Uncharacterized protein n=2 Tax=Terribacillus halophilus TaxID=361279 RepID=A0A1G6T8I1_9BACI|nr:hypothetical protein SAMN05421663_10870 [Terribacillus halophilus]
MNFLLEILGELAMLFIENLIPSRKGKRYKKNLKTLKKLEWFRSLMKEHRSVFLTNLAVRAKITEYAEDINLQKYKSELERIVKSEFG